MSKERVAVEIIHADGEKEIFGSTAEQVRWLRESPEVPVLIDEGEMRVIADVVQQMIAPVMEQIGGILERTNQAMERIAATQQMMSTRIGELEKQVRLKTPLSRSQEKCINDAIRSRAREILDGKGCADDRKAVTKLGGCIRRAVLARYGVASLREYPAYDYETALEQVRRWNGFPEIMAIVREAKERSEGGGDR